MSSIRRYKSGAEKRKEKEKKEVLYKSQIGSLDKYFKKDVVTDETRAEVGIENEQTSQNENENEQTSQNENENENVNENENENVNENENENENVTPNEEHNNEIGSICFDEDDPANWKQINQSLIDFLVEKGPKRNNDMRFPKDESDRSFSSSHYWRVLPNGERQDRRWLVYSASVDKVFCFCCKLFATNRHNVGLLGDGGLNDWHNISARLYSHERSKLHVDAIANWVDLEKRLKQVSTIDSSLQEHINKEKEHWKQVLQRILAVVKRLGRNNLAFRGDNEKIYEERNGLFLQMIELLAEFDPTMQEHVRRISKKEINYHYLSHKIQNELIQLMANEVKLSIVSTIKEAKYFSIILDCTPDVSNEEQMSLVVRCVNISKNPIVVEEFFIEFIKVDDTSGLGLFNELLHVLEALHLNVDDIRGQGYDNGANMKGKK